jgi:hypothetical protein
VNLKQQQYMPTQSERNQRLIPRLRHLADVVNIKLVRADRAKKASMKKEDTYDQQTQSPLSQ